MRLFQEDFHSEYLMGAVQAVPGIEDRSLKEKILESVEKLLEYGC